jgi:putative ABC transport system substrate-binding protein
LKKIAAFGVLASRLFSSVAIISLLVWPVSTSALAAAGAVAVVYPDVAEPYHSIFQQIIDGIEEKAGSTVIGIPIGANTGAQDLSETVRTRNVRTVIALGRNSLRLVASLGRDVAIVGGCIVSVPENEAKSQAIFSLAPDPSLLFAKLKAFLPAVTRVHVVFDPEQSGWLIRRAQSVAKAAGLELIAHQASDLKTALRLYQEILAEIDVKRDSLWLPQDPTTVEESAVLPFLLEEAWSRRLVIFSSNIGHVKRGALFSLFPNNREMGNRLGNWAAGKVEVEGGLVPLTDVSLAVNVRTAAHLGLQFTGAQERSFSLVFPEN